MSQPSDVLRVRVRELLLTEWDPAGAGRFDAAHGEYDGYVAPLIDVVRGGGDADAVIAFLHDREKESMCFPSLGTQRLRRVATMVVRAVREHDDAR